MKNSLLFIYRTNILERSLTINMKNGLTPKNPKMHDPILVTLLKMRPHYSQSSRENTTPSSGTSPSTSFKEVSPYAPPPGTNNAQTLLPGMNSVKPHCLNSRDELLESISLVFFPFQFLCCTSFPPLPFKQFLLRHSPSI